MLDPRTSVATIVLEHSECAPVLARHRIDYCCKGQRALAAACRDLGLAVEDVVEELETAIRRRIVSPVDPRTLSTPALIRDVIGAHHRYLHRTLPFLRALAAKVAATRGDRDPTLYRLSRHVDRLADTLLCHLHDEEHGLFPALLADEPSERAIELLVAMREDHEEVAELLATLRTITSDFRIPEGAGNSQHTLIRELEELEGDVLRHLHVENHVLLPRFVRAPDLQAAR